jgi:plastocyanin
MKSFIASTLLLASVVAALPQPSTKLAARGPVMKGMIRSHQTCLTLLTLPTPAQPHRRQNQIIPVVVGGPQDTFVPNSVVAAVGDIVQFQFSNGNHTVTQSTADAACKPMDAGIHSGHIPFQDGQTDVGTFNMPVTSTEPMFLYCATGPHCQLGQVMVVNPVNAKQVADYAKLSQASEKSVDGTNVVGGTAGKIGLATAA